MHEKARCNHVDEIDAWHHILLRPTAFESGLKKMTETDPFYFVIFVKLNLHINHLLITTIILDFYISLNIGNFILGIVVIQNKISGMFFIEALRTFNKCSETILVFLWKHISATFKTNMFFANLLCNSFEFNSMFKNIEVSSNLIIAKWTNFGFL